MNRFLRLARFLQTRDIYTLTQFLGNSVHRVQRSKIPVKFRQFFIKIDARNDEHLQNLRDLKEKIEKKLDKKSEIFEFSAVQRNANLVELEKRCKMRPFSLS